ncbi:aminotransferase class III-fold pyridoxal phosphate-dependent enzyme [Escherichia coli]
MTSPLPVYPVASAEGCELILSDGRRLVDGMSSWWAAIHGYNHPQLNAAMKSQIDAMSHVTFGGITHAPAIELCRTGGNDAATAGCVFLADSGSVAVEVATERRCSTGRPKAKRATVFYLPQWLSWRYLWRDVVWDPDNSMHSLWKGYLPENLLLPPAKPHGW